MKIRRADVHAALVTALEARWRTERANRQSEAAVATACELADALVELSDALSIEGAVDEARN
jgi:hypothetical protein